MPLVVPAYLLVAPDGQVAEWHSAEAHLELYANGATYQIDAPSRVDVASSMVRQPSVPAAVRSVAITWRAAVEYGNAQWPARSKVLRDPQNYLDKEPQRVEWAGELRAVGIHVAGSSSPSVPVRIVGATKNGIVHVAQIDVR